MDLLDYALADPAQNEWAARRAQNGHPQPFDLRYLGLGNENWGDVYWRNFEPLYNAVKDIVCGGDITELYSGVRYYRDPCGCQIYRKERGGRMLLLAGHKDVTLYEFDGYGHDMCAPGYPLLLRFVHEREAAGKVR